ncbi:amidohydrolase family protein [Amycolatopsis rubida]|uniref:Amidohydrolase-related domain-containing protein n=1 Tax=Amycolatopsis rubida TaxID=112413 RepID=A0A1I5SGU2_9PSEU|nr:amidohydrolase family protein [Amycolatopsis rubida]SFP69935.1 hypothetical protein SAMN05421854_106320 [Amycolatopsis rubida]
MSAPPGVFDAHQHYGNLLLSDAGGIETPASGQDSRDHADLADRIARMTAMNVDAALLMPVNRYLRPNGVADTRAVNDALAAYQNLDRARFPCAAGITEPLHGTAGLDEIRRIREELGFVGVSYHARWQGVSADDPWIKRGLAVAGELRLIPFVHAHAESALEAPTCVSNLARAFPDLPIVVTDAMSTTTNYLAYLDIAERFPNLYFDTSCVLHPALLRRWAARLGTAQLIFGTDLYSGGAFYTMTGPGEIAGLGLGPEAEAAVLGANFRRLLAWTEGENR